jgi:hypothetical protein
MAGHSLSKTGVNALLSRPSTSFYFYDVDARHKAGHDGFVKPLIQQQAFLSGS